MADPEQWVDVADDPRYATVVAELSARIDAFFATHADPRYDLWNGGTGQAMVSRYRLYKERYGKEWEVTTKVGPAFSD